jgi:hypothetical protein
MPITVVQQKLSAIQNAHAELKSDIDDQKDIIDVLRAYGEDNARFNEEQAKYVKMLNDLGMLEKQLASLGRQKNSIEKSQNKLLLTEPEQSWFKIKGHKLL